MLSPRRSCLALLALLGVALLAPRPAAADHDTYTVTDLGTLPGKAASWSFWSNVNNRGAVAAYANNTADPNAAAADAAYLWDQGTLLALPGLPGATDTVAATLNDNNLVVGFSGADGFQAVHAVAWEKGKVRDLGTYGSDPYSKALGVNNRGDIVGLSYIVDYFFFGEHAVVWEKGQIHVLPRLSGEGPHHAAVDINEKGQIVGHSNDYAVLWENKNSAPLPLGFLANSVAINDKTQVIGWIWNDNSFTQSRAFLWEKGALTVLNALHTADPIAIPYAINNKGQVVGQESPTFSFSNVTNAIAVLWENGDAIDLQTRIPSNSGWQLLCACGINERGQISGFGLHEGKLRACLLTPRKK